MPEKIESGAGKADVILIPTPGLSLFSTLPDTPLRGQWRVNIPNKAEKAFAVSGGTLYEVFTDGTFAARGTVANDAKPASLASSNIQLMIASGGQGYCLNFATNVLTGPIATIAGVTQVGYSDGFFVAGIGTTGQIYVSTALDGTNWNPATTAIVSVFPDNIVSMIVDHREICLLGQKQSVCYYDSGNVFPYDVIPGGFAEEGSAAMFGAVKADNTVFWIGKDERGQGIARKAVGYTPTRISTHAIELVWQGYSTIADAEAYTFQMNGHTIIHWYFPTANDSWDYDVATGIWFQMKSWNIETDSFSAHRSRCHMFAFGKHLVGDPLSGNIYEMSFPKTSDGGATWQFCTDFGNTIRRVRRSPYLGMASIWNFINSLEIICEMGLGPELALLDGGTGLYDSTLIESIGGSSVLKYQGKFQLHTLGGNSYIASGTFKNIAAVPVVIRLTINSQGTAQTTIPAGQIATVALGPLIGNAASGFLEIATQNVGDPLSVVGFNPYVENSTIAPGVNIFTGNALRFVTNGGQTWIAQSGATVTVTQNQPNVLSSLRGPRLMLRWSKDAGKTWSGERTIDLGKIGEYQKRAIFRRLGRFWGSLGWQIEVSFSDPVPCRLIDADIDADPAMKPVKRLPAELRERA